LKWSFANFCLGCPWTLILRNSACRVGGMTAVSHYSDYVLLFVLLSLGETFWECSSIWLIQLNYCSLRWGLTDLTTVVILNPVTCLKKKVPSI
jgi:hypothetical protein